MGESEIGQFLTHLAVKENVTASTQNQALCTIVFLYKNVLKIELEKFQEIELRQKVKMLGGRWNSKEKVWKIANGKVKILNLEERIVEETEKE